VAWRARSLGEWGGGVGGGFAYSFGVMGFDDLLFVVMLMLVFVAQWW